MLGAARSRPLRRSRRGARWRATSPPPKGTIRKPRPSRSLRRRRRMRPHRSRRLSRTRASLLASRSRHAHPQTRRDRTSVRHPYMTARASPHHRWWHRRMSRAGLQLERRSVSHAATARHTRRPARPAGGSASALRFRTSRWLRGLLRRAHPTRNLGSLAPRLRQTDGHSLLATRDPLARASRAQRPALEFVHGAFDVSRRLRTVFTAALLLRRLHL